MKRKTWGAGDMIDWPRYLVFLLAVAIVSGDDETYLEALRARQLDGLLEAESRRILAAPKTPELAARARLYLATVLSRRGSQTLAEAERKQLWAESDRWLDDALGDRPSLETSLDLQYARANMLLDRGRTLSELAKVVDDASLKRDALASVRKVLDIAGTIAELVKGREQDAANKSEHDLDRWLRFGLAVDLLTGQANLLAARLENDPHRRVDAIDNAVSSFGGDSQRAFSTLPYSLEMSLGLAEALELQGKPERALAVLLAFDTMRYPELAKPPLDSYEARARVLRARILLARNQVEEALRTVALPEDKRISAEWEFVLFEALLKRGKDQSRFDPEGGKKSLQQALVVLDRLEAVYGPYWRRRGELTLVEFAPLLESSNQPRLLRQVAAVLKDSREFGKAIDLLDRASQTEDAIERGQARFLAAAIRLEDGAVDDAVRRFREFVREQPDHPLAAKASLAAAAALGAKIREQPTEERKRDYRDALESHRRQFPGDKETIGEILLALGELEESAGRIEEAIRCYKAVPQDNKQFSKAVTAWADLVHDQVLIAPNASPEERRPLAESALAELDRVVEAAGKSADWQPAVDYVRARLLAFLERNDHAVTLLDSALESKSLDAGRRERAWRLRLELAVATADTEAALRIVSQGFPGEKELVSALASLDLESKRLTEDARKTAAAAVLKAMSRLDGKLDPGDVQTRYRLRRQEAEATLIAGSASEAEKLFRRLTLEEPNDARALRGLARALFVRGEYAASAPLWARLLAAAERGRPDWFEALYFSCECLARTNAVPKARSALETMRRFYPDCGGPDWKSKFDDLDRRLRDGANAPTRS